LSEIWIVNTFGKRNPHNARGLIFKRILRSWIYDDRYKIPFVCVCELHFLTYVRAPDSLHTLDHDEHAASSYLLLNHFWITNAAGIFEIRPNDEVMTPQSFYNRSYDVTIPASETDEDMSPTVFLALHFDLLKRF
jgi:hypothetical protein